MKLGRFSIRKSWRVLPALRVPATKAVETLGPHRRPIHTVSFEGAIPACETGLERNRVHIRGRSWGRDMEWDIGKGMQGMSGQF